MAVYYNYLVIMLHWRSRFLLLVPPLSFVYHSYLYSRYEFIFKVDVVKFFCLDMKAIMMYSSYYYCHLGIITGILFFAFTYWYEGTIPWKRKLSGKILKNERTKINVGDNRTVKIIKYEIRA